MTQQQEQLAEKILQKHCSDTPDWCSGFKSDILAAIVEAMNSVKDIAEKDNFLSYKELQEECKRLAGVAEFWQNKYYELNPPHQPIKLDNL